MKHYRVAIFWRWVWFGLVERWQGCNCWMIVPVLCLHTAGGLRFLAHEDVLGSLWRDAETGNTAGAAKCQSHVGSTSWGTVSRDLCLGPFVICWLWVVWILHGILAACLGSNAPILFIWILRRLHCGAFHMNWGWVLPLFGPWKGWFSVSGGYIPELSDEGHGGASIQRSPQEEKVEVSEGSGAEIKWNKTQSCKGLYVSLLLWLREGGQREALLIPPPTPTPKEKGVHVCWRGHHRWLLHHRVCVPRSPGGKRWPTIPPHTSCASLRWLVFFIFYFLFCCALNSSSQEFSNKGPNEWKTPGCASIGWRTVARLPFKNRLLVLFFPGSFVTRWLSIFLEMQIRRQLLPNIVFNMMTHTSSNSFCSRYSCCSALQW